MHIRATLENARARLQYYLPTIVKAHLRDAGGFPGYSLALAA